MSVFYAETNADTLITDVKRYFSVNLPNGSKIRFDESGQF